MTHASRLGLAGLLFAVGCGSQLLQTYRRGKAGRPCPDDDDVVLHPFALKPFLAHRLPPAFPGQL